MKRVFNVKKLYGFFLKPVIDRTYFGKRQKGGELNPEKKICVLQCKSRVGWFSHCNDHILPNAILCERKGITPVVDMKSFSKLLWDEAVDYNFWERYYEQCDGISLEEAFNSKHIRVKECDSAWRAVGWNCHDIFDSIEKRRLFCEAWVKYIRLNTEVMSIIDEQYESLFPEKDRGSILGCSFRGTDYLREKPFGHFIQPSAEQCAESIKEKLKEWNCNKIYLSTEDQSIFEMIKSAFGDMVISFEASHYARDEDMFSTQRQNSLILDYILSKGILAKCDYLIAGRTGGTIATIGMNGMNFKDEYIFDLGRYGINEN